MCMACKKKMSDKTKTKSMSEILTPEFVAELKKLMPDGTAALSAKITELETKLAADNKLALESSKKSEIAALVAEAGKAGKVIPMTDAQLLKLDISEVKEIIGKLSPAQVQLSRGWKPVPPKDDKGETIFDRHTAEGRAKVVQFCRQKQAENAPMLGAEIKRINAGAFPETN